MLYIICKKYALYVIKILVNWFLWHIQHMKTLPELGKEVARLRKSRGLTQKDLAKLSALGGQSTLARFETGGVGEFGARKLLRLLEVMGFELTVVPSDQEFTLDDALEQRRRKVAMESK
jgi:transcriptional regulator with XRE-family HTH domain